jgi:hypothetical protein
MGLAVPAGLPLGVLLGLNGVSLGAARTLVARIVICPIPQRQINCAPMSVKRIARESNPFTR